MERWFSDRQGREIYSHIRLRLWRYGYALERIGFKNQSQNY
jgi:hypothetical protein